ncbi:MAG: hypothetical protein WBE68_17450, partial [Candidatus Nitrosopolaris sp.]
TSREVHEMFKTTAIDTLKQDKKCQACWYMILSTMSGSTTIKQRSQEKRICIRRIHHLLIYDAGCGIGKRSCSPLF